MKVITVGWNPNVILDLLKPIEEKSEIKFIHLFEFGSRRLQKIKRKYSFNNIDCFAVDSVLEIANEFDLELLHKLENVYHCSISCIIDTDCFLKDFQNKDIALSYLSLIAKNLYLLLNKLKPDYVICSNDRAHSHITFAICKLLEIPCYAFAFTVIPNDRTWFIDKLEPNCLVPFERENESDFSYELAQKVVSDYMDDKLSIMAYKAPFKLTDYFNKFYTKIIKTFFDQDIFLVPGITKPFLKNSIKDNLDRFKNRLALKYSQFIFTYNGKFAYFPLHMSNEAMVNTWAPMFIDQLALVRQVSMSLPVGMKLIVKLHFSDPDYYSIKEIRKILKLSNVLVAHPSSSSRWFIKNSSLVFGISGTSCLEASLFGIPTILFSNSPYLHFPNTIRSTDVTKLKDQVFEMLKKNKPTQDQITTSFMNYVLRYKKGRINDWSIKSSQSDQENFLKILRSI